MTDDLVGREPPPIEPNDPPHIVEESISPPNWQAIKPSGDVTCNPVELKIGTVIDADLTDTLTVRWFRDYDTSPGAPKTIVAQGILPAATQAARTGDALKYVFDPSAAGVCKGVHVIKVMISDGFAFDSSDLAKVQPGKDVASNSWTIDTSACSNGGGACL